MFATMSVEFSCDKTIYRQVDGIAMGSPLRPMLTNIFVSFYDQDLFTRIKGPNYYDRYIGDTLCEIINEIGARVFYQALNTLPPDLHFTREKENNVVFFLSGCSGTHIRSRY